MDRVMLGEGTYAQVTSLGEVAVKTIPHKNLESAVREIGLANACSHPNVVSIDKIEIGPASTRIYMKKYACDLLAYMNAWGPLPVDTVYAIARGIVAGVAHVHGRGIIHGDLKPQNVLMDTPARAQPVPVICDFGIAVTCNERYHTSRIQTCTYRAPEVDYDRARVQYSPRVDMWSVGCMLLELACGSPAVAYVEGVEDSSWYACKLFGISGCDTRKQRMRVLRDVNTRYIRHVVEARLAGDPARYRKLFDSGFVQLITHCLHPNHNKRVDSGSALSLVGHLFGRVDIFESSPAVIPRFALDDMQCAVNVSESVISICSATCMSLAEILYLRYVGTVGECGIDAQYACVFIASCIFSGSGAVADAIFGILTRGATYAAVGAVMATLRGRVL